jgi:hypothetical protein
MLRVGNRCRKKSETGASSRETQVVLFEQVRGMGTRIAQAFVLSWLSHSWFRLPRAARHAFMANCQNLQPFLCEIAQLELFPLVF